MTGVIGKKVAVTGGAGFIGSHLVEELLVSGSEVIVIDNFAGGSKENLANVCDDRRLTVCNIDICDTEKIRDVLRGVDVVYHLAALADIVPSIKDPSTYFRANVMGTVEVLESCRLNNVSRFIYAASSSCYGIPTVYPTSETSNAQPMYPYALTKYLGEQSVLHWYKTYGLPVVSLRLFNVFGPRARTSGAYGAVFGVFLAQKLAGKPFTVVGDGTQTRDFTFVTDVVSAFLMAGESKIEGEVFNVGSDNTYSVNQLVKLLGGDVVHISKRPGEPDCTYADISKIRDAIGWEPTVSFEEGVNIMKENIAYWKTAPLWTSQSITEATQDWFKYLGASTTGCLNSDNKIK